uniref:PUM-HD domain-containing protein n=1 Tax=Globodera rostochiensis TaxID=31243 RepID=A0A914H102_GLORO
MVSRLICNFLNGQHIICKIQHVQTVHVAFLHQHIKNVCPAAVLSCGARMASSSSNRPSNRSKLSDKYSNNGGSQLLDDYHNNRAANLQLADLGKHAMAFALDPQGSRFIEQKLGRARSTGKAQLMDALRGHVLKLAKQMYGSHVIEAALKSVDKASQMEIINEISAQVTPLSLHKYGCRVIECLLEHCTEQQKRPVYEQLLENVPTLVTDPYGNFVIQHAIEHGLPEDRERIVRSLKGDIMKYAQDKFGSLVILKCLICGTADQKKTLIDNVCVEEAQTLQNARQLMADEFGHYVIQKFFEYGTDDQKARLVDALRGHVLTLSLQIYGGPMIQKALKSVDKALQMEIIEELTPRACVIRCIKDRYGMHVMNMIFELIEPQRLQFVVDAITTSPSNSVASLSLHEYGNWVIRSVLERCTEQQKRPVFEKLLENVPTLVTDQYGCFVIRHAIEHGRAEDRERIMRSLHEKVTSLSLHEYGSRVIERVLELCTEQQKRPMLEQLLENVPTLATDKYGSHVIQHVIEHGRAEDRERIMRLLHENLFTLVTDPYGNFVIQYVIEHGLPEDRERIVRNLKGDILKNAHHKGICSVIEKCLVFGTTEQRNALIDQVCTDNGSGKPPLLEMMKHPFANDCVLKMHDFADSAHRDKMMFAIKEHIPALIRLKARQSEHQSLTAVQAQQRGVGTVADKRKKPSNG